MTKEEKEALAQLSVDMYRKGVWDTWAIVLERLAKVRAQDFTLEEFSACAKMVHANTEALLLSGTVLEDMLAKVRSSN